VKISGTGRKRVGKIFANYWQLYLFLLLPLLWLFVFKYYPMLGAQIAFKNFRPQKGIWGSDWVGLKNFIKFFSSYQFSRVMINTLTISLFSRFGEPGVDWVVPPEGSIALGSPWGAKPEILPVLIWGSSIPQKSHWGDMTPHILLQKYTDGQAWNGDPTDAEYMISLCVPGLLNKEPPEIATLILYNAEEADQAADIQTSLNTYVRESMARFAIGDLSLDRDWDGYLRELNRIGLPKFLEISQKAYNRMMGK
jgi:hypothetical protein